MDRPLYEPLKRICDMIAEGFIMVTDRLTAATTPMTPTQAQERMLLRMLDQASQGQQIEIHVPKSRKHGISTCAQAVFVALNELMPGRYCRTYAQTREDSKIIFRIAQQVYRHLTGRDVDNQSQIAHPNGSIYECSTFGGRGAGRGGTPRGLHFSELAAMVTGAGSGADKAAVVASVSALPDAPDTILICESTGNGPQGAFYEWCMEAKENRKKKDKLLFLPWYIDTGLQEEPESDFVKTETEQARSVKFALSDRQLSWYRTRSKKMFTPQHMRKEFPEVLEDCFCAASGLVYPTFSIDDVKDGGNVGEIEMAADRPRYRGIDWGFSATDPFVCLWAAHDRTLPPGLAIHPSCTNLIRELQSYVNDDKGYPVDQWNHGPDVARYLVVDGRFTGLTYIYKELYLYSCASPSFAARRVHEESGWVPPANSELADDFGRWGPGKNAEKYQRTVADRSGLGFIKMFRGWRMGPIDGQRDAVERGLVKKGESQGEIKDGIGIVLSLISGDARFFATFEDPADKAQKKLDDAQAAVGGRAVRVRLTNREQTALAERFNRETHATEKSAFDIAI